MSQAVERNPGSSSLLTFLTQLSDDAWSQALLPQLWARGCVAAVAQTCSQLRDLCYSTVERIDLKSLRKIKDPLELQRYTQNLGAHFSACSSVALYLQDASNYHCMPYMIPALRSLAIACQDRQDTVLAGTLLLCLRTQLMHVQELQLNVRQSWAGASLPWHELGNFTQLTSLTIGFEEEVTWPLSPKDLTPLSQLTKLRHLQIDLTADNPDMSVGCVVTPELLQSLTALTSLACSGGRYSALEHIGSCTTLQNLMFSCALPDPGAADSQLASVGQLTALSRLVLSATDMVNATDSFCSALAQLAGLEVLKARMWSPNLLPSLATCRKLRCLGGGWLGGWTDNVPEALQLPTVRTLDQTSGSVPVSAFPGLTALLQMEPVSPDVYLQLSEHCKGLVCLTIPSDSLSLDDHRQYTTAQHTAAIRALAGLTRLELLAVGVRDDAQTAVFAHVVARLTRHSLRTACMYVGPNMSPSSVMHIAQVVGLANFGIDARFLKFNHQEKRMLLQACHGISNVWVAVEPEDKDKFEEAESWLQSAGLWQHQLQTLVISASNADAVYELCDSMCVPMQQVPSGRH